MSNRKSGMGIIGMLGFLLILVGLALLVGTLIAFVLHRTGSSSSVGRWLDTVFYVKGLKNYSVLAGFIGIGVGAIMCYIDEK